MILNKNEKEFLRNFSEVKLTEVKLNDLSQISLREHFYIGKQFKKLNQIDSKNKNLEIRSKLDDAACNSFKNISDDIVCRLYYGEELCEQSMVDAGY